MTRQYPVSILLYCDIDLHCNSVACFYLIFVRQVSVHQDTGLEFRYWVCWFDFILLGHSAQSVYRGLHVVISESHQQTVVLDTDLVDGLPSALLQPPFQLRGQVLEAVLCWVHQLQLRTEHVSLRTCWFKLYLINAKWMNHMNHNTV